MYTKIENMNSQIEDLNIQKEQFIKDKEGILDTICTKVEEKTKIMIESILDRSDLSECDKSFERKLNYLDDLNNKAEDLVNNAKESNQAEIKKFNLLKNHIKSSPN